MCYLCWCIVTACALAPKIFNIFKNISNALAKKYIGNVRAHIRVHASRPGACRSQRKGSYFLEHHVAAACFAFFANDHRPKFVFLGSSGFNAHLITLRAQRDSKLKTCLVIFQICENLWAPLHAGRGKIKSKSKSGIFNLPIPLEQDRTHCESNAALNCCGSYACHQVCYSPPT